MSEIFDELPSSPEEEGRLVEIKKIISEKLYLELTEGDASVLSRAVRHAKIKTSAMLKLVDVKLDENLELHRQVIDWLTVYFLYVFNGNCSAENEWLEMARSMIANHYHRDKLEMTARPAGSVFASTWTNRYKK